MPLEQILADRLPLLRGFVVEDRINGSQEMLAALSAFETPVGLYEAPNALVSEYRVGGPHGTVPVRIYKPPSGKHSGAGLVWLHGGGFAGGSVDMPEAEVTARELCTRIDATIVSVDYRLVRDDVSFPVPHDDVVAAWNWTLGAAAELGIEPGRLALGGGSAGANLAAGATLALRDVDAPLPSVLLLLYPGLHYELPTSDAMPEDMDSLPVVLRILPGSAAAVNDRYLGGAEPTPYAFPALGELAGLPRTLIVTAEYDDLRPSGEAFAQALERAGVDVVLRCEPGVVHGYFNIPGLAGWERSLRTFAAALLASR